MAHLTSHQVHPQTLTVARSSRVSSYMHTLCITMPRVPPAGSR